MASAVLRTGLLHARVSGGLAALCCVAFWLGACSEGYPAREPRALNAALPGVAGQVGATAGEPGAGCMNCAGATLPMAGLGGRAGSFAPAGAPAAGGGGRGNAVAGASGISAAGRSGAGAGTSGTSSAGRSGAGGAGTSGASGAGRGGAGAGGSVGTPAQCQASTCPDCRGLENPCCQSNGTCGCRLLLICN